MPVDLVVLQFNEGRGACTYMCRSKCVINCVIVKNNYCIVQCA